jgi:hypothetical protein
MRSWKEGERGVVTVEPLAVLLAWLERAEDDAREDKSSPMISRRCNALERRAKRLTFSMLVFVEDGKVHEIHT